MSHDNHVNIVGNHLDGVLEGFAFALACIRGIREADYLCSEAVDGCFKAEPRPGRRFEEQAGDDLAFKKFLLLVLLEFPGCFKYMKDFLFTEIPN